MYQPRLIVQVPSGSAVERQLSAVGPEVLVLERRLAMEEQIVHVPEAALERGRVG